MQGQLVSLEFVAPLVAFLQTATQVASRLFSGDRHSTAFLSVLALHKDKDSHFIRI